jgi:hypothetical protein
MRPMPSTKTEIVLKRQLVAAGLCAFAGDVVKPDL